MQEDNDSRSLVISEMMTPDKVNFGGNIHGGDLLKLFDQVAYACATRYASHPVVTFSVDQVFFKQPIYVGELVICYASVNYVGRSSLEVGIKVLAENLVSGEKRHTNSCFFTMVAINEQRKPIPVKPLTLNTETQIRRFNEAKHRRELRLRNVNSPKGSES